MAAKLLTGHPDRHPHELVFLADLTGELRAWPRDTWAAAGVDPAAVADAVVACWRTGDIQGLAFEGVSFEEARALARPAMTAVAASHQRPPARRHLPVAIHPRGVGRTPLAAGVRTGSSQGSRVTAGVHPGQHRGPARCQHGTGREGALVGRALAGSTLSGRRGHRPVAGSTPSTGRTGAGVRRGPRVSRGRAAVSALAVRRCPPAMLRGSGRGPRRTAWVLPGLVGSQTASTIVIMQPCRHVATLGSVQPPAGGGGRRCARSSRW
jgi:hypothetical protein